MLRCLFGKCSSETYVVNPKDRPVSKTNGVIVPVSSEPSSPTKVKKANHQNVDTTTIAVPATPQVEMQQKEISNTQDNEEIVKYSPASNQLSSQKHETQEHPAKEDVKQVLPKGENTYNKGIDTIENDTSVPLKTRSQAPQPPEVKKTVDTEVTVLIPEPKKPIIKDVEQNINEDSKVVIQVNESSGASPSVINSEQDKHNKIEEVGSTHVINSEHGRSNKNEQIFSAPIVNSEESKNNKKEQVASVPIISAEETKNIKKEQVAITSVISSEESENSTKVQVASAPEINSGKNKNIAKAEAVSVPVINSEQDKYNKIEKVASATVINSGETTITKREEVTSTSVINSEKDENVKKEKGKVRIELQENIIEEEKLVNNTIREESIEADSEPIRRRSGVVPLPVKYDESKDNVLTHFPKDPDDEALIKSAIESNDFLNKIISGKRLEDVVYSMYNREIASKETIIKQGEKGSHMYISAKGKYQVLVKGKVVSEFDDVRVFGELAILYNAKRLATIKALTPGRVWVLDRSTYQQIMLRYNIKEQDEIMLFLMNNKTLNVVGQDVLQEVANLLKPEFFSSGKQIVRQGDKGHKFYIIRAGTVTITKEGEGIVGVYEKGDCFGELALLKEDSRQATVTANAPGAECLTLTRKEFIDYFGEVDDITKLKPRPQNSIKDAVIEHGDIDLVDLQIIKTLGVGGFGRVELVQHTKKKELVFALKYLKKIDIVLQHQQDHVYNEKDIQMSSKSPFIIRLYRTYKDSKYIYFLMESCLGGDLFSLLQKQKLRRFDEKEARFIAACVLEAFDYLHSRGIVYRDLKPENLLIAANGYIKLTDFGFAKKISSRGRTYTFAGTPEYVAPEIVLNKGHDRAVDYWAFGAFIFELLTGRTPFRTDDSTHMKTYNKILNGIDNIQFPSYVNLKARHIIEKLCRPIPAERLGMQRGGIKDIKAHKWFLGWDWQKFAKCEMSSPFKPKLKSTTDTQYFDKFKKDTDDPPQELSGWDENF